MTANPNPLPEACPAPSFLPAAAVLEMTYRCNHACLYCSCPWEAEGNGFDRRPELTPDEWTRHIRTLVGMGVTSLAFTGGETLLKEGLASIVADAAKLEATFIESQNGSLVTRRGPPRLYLLSNGSAMSDDVLDLCHRHNVHLSLSLPGLSTFRRHTQAGSADTVLGWFRAATARGVTTTVNITVTRINLFELHETIAEALLAGATTLLMNRFLPGGRGLRHATELSLDRAGVATMLATAETVLRQANRRGSVGTELPQCLVDPARHTHLRIGTRCSAALDFFVVDPSGYTRVCNHSPVRLNHLDDLANLKHHPYWKRYVMKDYLPGACRRCPEMARCDGGCREAAHIVGGQVDALDPLMGG